MTDINNSELKCCPFCGGEAGTGGNDITWFEIVCKKCTATGGIAETVEEATETWNIRITDIPADISKRIDKPVMDALDKLKEAKESK